MTGVPWLNIRNEHRGFTRAGVPSFFWTCLTSLGHIWMIQGECTQPLRVVTCSFVVWMCVCLVVDALGHRTTSGY